MWSDYWFVVQLLSVIGAGVSGFFAAGFFFFESVATEADAARFREPLRGWLERLHGTSLTRFPERLGELREWMYAVQTSAVRWIVSTRAGSTIFGTLAAIVCLMSVYVQFGRVWIWAAVLPMLVQYGLSLRITGGRLSRVARYAGDFGTLALAALGFLACIRYATALHPIPSMLVAILISPIGLVIADAVATFGRDEESRFSDEVTESLYTLGAGVGFSALATVAALALGHVAEPAAHQPALSIQALVVNLLCDGLTLVLCSRFLGRRAGAGRSPGVVRLFVSCIAAASVLAWLSVYLSFVFTPDELSMRETARVFIGRAPTGDRVELGGYFFQMHTTFLPVLLYLGLLVLAVLLKGVTAVAEGVVVRSIDPLKNPFRTTALLLGVFGAFFTAVAGVASLAKERAQAKEDRDARVQAPRPSSWNAGPSAGQAQGPAPPTGSS